MTGTECNVNTLEPDDHELIRRIASGDQGAFDVLVRRHQDRVYNLCYWFVGDAHDADDLAQEVFIRVYGALENFRFESRFSTWLYRIAVNTCKNRVKSLAYRFRKWTQSIEAVDRTTGASFDEAAGGTTDAPDELMARFQKSAHIKDAVNRLSADKKTVAILRDIEGMSYEEIAGVTGMKPGTVKSKLFRARQDLKAMLKDRI